MQRLADAIGRLKGWRRQRRRRFKKYRKLTEAELVLVSHAKSGRTWLVTMLSHYYHVTRGTPANQLINGGGFKQYDSGIPNLFYTSGWEFDPGANIEQILGGKKVIFLYRDPRDVVVSWFHHMAHRMPAFDLRNLVHGLGMPNKLTAEIALRPAWLPSVMRFMNEWLYRCRKLQHAHVISYESMRADPERCLRNLLAFIGETADAEAISRAVSFGSFDNMKRLERAGFFASGRLNGGTASDPDSFKVRRGSVGGYREHFGADGAAALDAYVKNNLDPAFGYGANSPMGGSANSDRESETRAVGR